MFHHNQETASLTISILFENRNFQPGKFPARKTAYQRDVSKQRQPQYGDHTVPLAHTFLVHNASNHQKLN